MKNTFLTANKIKNKPQFLDYCVSMMAKNSVDLASKLDVSRQTLYRMFDYFEVSKAERKLVFDIGADHNEAKFDPYSNAPSGIYGGTFHPFKFKGVTFYIHKESSNGYVNVLRLSRGKLKYVSEIDIDGEISFYFHDANGTRKTVKRNNFMYCYYHSLQDIPSGKRIAIVDSNDDWFKKGNLVALDVAKKATKANSNAMERAIAMSMNGDKRGALKYISDFIDSSIHAIESE